jgi:putative membrane protein
MWRDWHGYGWGMMGDWGTGWMFFPGLLWLVVLALVVAGIILLVRSNDGRDAEARATRRADGLAILEERYARGEINRDEFFEKKQDLSR